MCYKHRVHKVTQNTDYNGQQKRQQKRTGRLVTGDRQHACKRQHGTYGQVDQSRDNEEHLSVCYDRSYRQLAGNICQVVYGQEILIQHRT